MIALLVIALLFGNGFGGGNRLNLSDPAVLAAFTEHVSAIVKDPQKASKVTDAAYRLNIMSREVYSETGAVEQNIRKINSILVDYNATREEVHAALGGLNATLKSVNQTTVQEREVMRQNTTGKEWENLLKELASTSPAPGSRR